MATVSAGRSRQNPHRQGRPGNMDDGVYWGDPKIRNGMGYRPRPARRDGRLSLPGHIGNIPLVPGEPQSMSGHHPTHQQGTTASNPIVLDSDEEADGASAVSRAEGGSSPIVAQGGLPGGFEGGSPDGAQGGISSGNLHTNHEYTRKRIRSLSMSAPCTHPAPEQASAGPSSASVARSGVTSESHGGAHGNDGVSEPTGASEIGAPAPKRHASALPECLRGRKFRWVNHDQTRCELLDDKRELMVLDIGDSVLLENNSIPGRRDATCLRARRDEYGFKDTWRGKIVSMHDSKDGPTLKIQWWWRFEEICDFEGVGASNLSRGNGRIATGPNQYLLYAHYGPEEAGTDVSDKTLVHSRELFLQAGDLVEKNPFPVHLVIRKFNVTHLSDLRTRSMGNTHIEKYCQGKDNFWYHLSYDGAFRFETAARPTQPPARQLASSLLASQSASGLLHLPTSLRALDLCAGCGGMSLGLSKAGVKVAAAVDVCRKAMAVHNENFPIRKCADCGKPKDISGDFNTCDDVDCHSVNITGCMGYAMPLEEFLDHCKEGAAGYPKPGNFELIHLSPPCQNLSGANRLKDAERPELRHILESAVELISYFKPLYVTLEEVAGFLGTLDDRDERNEMLPFAFFVTYLLSMGYQLDMRLLDAANYGVPQSRVRCIIVAAMAGIPLPKLPKPRYGTQPPRTRSTDVFHTGTWKTIASYILSEEEAEGLPPAVTVHEAIGDLPRVTDANSMGCTAYRPRGDPSPFAKCMREDCAEPKVWHHEHEVAPGKLTLSEQQKRRIRGSELFPTITKAVDRLVSDLGTDVEADRARKTRCRKLSIAERKRAQSFPDHFKFLPTTKADIHQMLGNAVPPLLAWELGASIMEACGLGVRMRRPPLLKSC